MPGSDIAWNSFETVIKDNTALVFDHSMTFHAIANQLGSLQWIVAGRGAYLKSLLYKTSQELPMLSSVTIDCQVTMIVINSGSQLSEL